MDGEPLSRDESALNLLGGFDNYQYATNVLVRERLARFTSQEVVDLDRRLNLSSKTSLKGVLDGENVVWTQSDLVKMISVFNISPNMSLVPSDYVVGKMSSDQKDYWLRRMFRGEIPEVPVKGQGKEFYSSTLAGYIMFEALQECDKIAKQRLSP